MSWFKAESQIPINVGDKKCDPLFPYGGGTADRIAEGSGLAGSGRSERACASVQRPDAVPADVQQAAAATSSQTSCAERDLLVSAARNLAEQAITTPAQMSATAALTANAEHELVAGNTLQAVQLLVKARSLALVIPG
jgi:beta-glucosidase